MNHAPLPPESNSEASAGAAPRKVDAAQAWDIERYLLGDDSLDREAFEARMLTDASLAWAVADALRHLQLLQLALSQPPSTAAAVAHSVERNQVVPQLARGGAGHGVARLRRSAAGLMGLAAAVSLLGVVVWWNAPARPTDPTVLGDAVAEDHLQAVAQHWLAMESEVAAGDLGPRETVVEREGYSAWSSTESLETVGGAPADGDWMMEVAAQFFQNADI